MAIVRVQNTGRTSVAFGGSPAVSFGVLPTVGNMIRVQIDGLGDVGGWGVTVADNQGNTYVLDKASADYNGSRAQLWHCSNVVTSAGTFTITATRTGSTGQLTGINATEFSGFGGVVSVTDTASNGNNNSVGASVGPTGVIAVAEALVSAVMAAGTLASIVVETVVPAWVEDYNQAFPGFSGSGDSRVVTDGLAQSCHWTNNQSSSWAAVLAVYSPTVVPSTSSLTQMGKEVVYVETSEIRLTQIAREVVYKFTCVPGPPPTPPPPPGCPAPTLHATPVTGQGGCAPEV